MSYDPPSDVGRLEDTIYALRDSVDKLDPDDERARWERFFAAALQGTAGSTLLKRRDEEYKHWRDREDPAADVVCEAARIADEAVRVADERAEARRKGGA